MKLMLLMACRNLFRQKSRSVLIGLGICASTMFLIVGYSMNKGMYWNLVDTFVGSNIFGHCTVNISEKYNSKTRAIIRDRDAIVSLIKNSSENIEDVRESLTVYAQASANGKGIELGLSGISATSLSDIRNMEIVEGDFGKFIDGCVENPLILEHNRAKALKVRAGDIVRIRLSTVYEQVQTARLSLVATVELTNPMMANTIQGILPLGRLKEIVGYRPHETQRLNIVLKDLKKSGDMVRLADSMVEVLWPGSAFIEGEFSANGARRNGILTGIQSDTASIQEYCRQISLLDGEMDLFEEGKGRIHVSKTLAVMLDLKPGSSIQLLYRSKFGAKNILLDFVVAGIVNDPGIGDPNAAFIDDETFFKAYLNDLPAIGNNQINETMAADSPLNAVMAHSWKLADRTYTSQDFERKQRNFRKETYNGSILDIVSMQEFASDVFRMESQQDSTIIGIMLIALIIIMTGIVNTTCMNIRERTREIGTVRAIGMQRKTVARSLVAEVEILCALAMLTGIFAAWGLMKLISLIPIHTNDFYLSTILNNGHLAFKSPVGLITVNILVILAMNFLAVYFPARKAVKKPVADALGHHE